jgi:hypothetical protein
MQRLGVSLSGTRGGIEVEAFFYRETVGEAPTV